MVICAMSQCFSIPTVGSPKAASLQSTAPTAQRKKNLLAAP